MARQGHHNADAECDVGERRGLGVWVWRSGHTRFLGLLPPVRPRDDVAFGYGTTQTMTYDNRYRIMQNKLAATSNIAQYDYG